MLRSYRLTVLRVIILALVCGGAACFPYLVDSEMRNLELAVVNRSRMRPVQKNSDAIRTLFKTTDPYIQYTNQLMLAHPQLSRGLPGLYAGSAMVPAEQVEVVQETLQSWRSVLHSIPDDDGVLENISRLYLSIGQNENALEAAQRALKLAPKDYSHLVNLGLLQEASGMKGDAVRSYSGALAIYPRLVQSPFWREFTKRDEASAREALAGAIRENESAYTASHDVVAGERLARLLLAIGDSVRAAQLSATLLHLSQQLEGAWELQGEVAQDSHAAALCYRRAIFLDPSDPLPYVRLGELALTDRDMPSAANYWLAALRLHRSLRTPHAQTAKLRYRLPISAANDSIPETWIYYISPAFHFSAAFSRIAASFESSGQLEDARLFEHLAQYSR
jgi:tetratricopeptide (TPR) repeat protein